MKILVLTHKLKVEIKDSLNECLIFLRENIPSAVFEVDYKEVDYALPNVRMNTLQYHGQYQVVLYAFDRKSQKKNNSDSWQQTKDMVLIQLCTGKEEKPYIWADMAHEMMHAFAKLSNSPDVMDSYEENDNPRSKTGNFAKQFKLLNLSKLFPMNTPQYIIVHHTGGTDKNPLADTSHHTAAMIKQWHLQLGWSDIGYNWVIEKDGKIVKGRDEKKEGAHTKGMNSKSIGVCLSGNFDATLPTKAQEEAFKTLYKELQGRYSVLMPDRVVPHRKYAQKTCYGKLLKDDWASNLARQAFDDTPSDDMEAVIEYIKKHDKTWIQRLIKRLG